VLPNGREKRLLRGSDCKIRSLERFGRGGAGKSRSPGSPRSSAPGTPTLALWGPRLECG
jgi:hypothetical protein